MKQINLEQFLPEVKEPDERIIRLDHSDIRRTYDSIDPPRWTGHSDSPDVQATSAHGHVQSLSDLLSAQVAEDTAAFHSDSNGVLHDGDPLGRTKSSPVKKDGKVYLADA